MDNQQLAELLSGIAKANNANPDGLTATAAPMPAARDAGDDSLDFAMS